MTQPVPASAPTQTRYPWRATARTAVAFLLGAATILPYVLAGAHVDGTVLGGQVLAVATGITRVMAMPQVDLFLRQWVPGLAAAPPQVPAPPK